jgi:hypothetical protein
VWFVLRNLLGFVVRGFVVRGFVVRGFVVRGFVVRGFVVRGFVVRGFAGLDCKPTLVVYMCRVSVPPLIALHK